MVGWSSDGDPRLLNAMKMKTEFVLAPDIDVIKRVNPYTICVQDTIHIGTKMRNRLLNTSVSLKIGNKIASIAHIKMLLEHPKEWHGLVITDINPEDRQNYKSLEKIMNSRVISALKYEIVDSEATMIYLTICDQITSSFLNTDLSPIDRVYKLWNAVYFLRCWRKSIVLDKNLTTTENFITNNAYICVEINAHALIYLIVKLRSSQTENMFLTHEFSSQPCESTFRQLRSMGTANYTKINFNLYELVHIIARLELINKIAYSNEEIIFPRVQSKNQLSVEQKSILPTDQQIADTMNNALQDALQTIAQFGINLTESDVISVHDKLLTDKINENLDDYSALHSSSESDLSDLATSLETILQADTEANVEINAGTFVDVIDSDGSTKKIKKSTFIWMHSKSNEKLSSDRSQRVRGSSKVNTNKRFKHDWTDKPNLVKMEHIAIGDWVVFKCSKDSVSANVDGDYLIGAVYGFKYANDKKRRKFKFNHVQINEQDNFRNRNSGIAVCPSTSQSKNQIEYSSNIEIIGTWYTFNENGRLSSIQENKFANIKNYIGTLKNPIVNREQAIICYTLPCEYSELNTLIAEIVQNISQKE